VSVDDECQDSEDDYALICCAHVRECEVLLVDRQLCAHVDDAHHGGGYGYVLKFHEHENAHVFRLGEAKHRFPSRHLRAGNLHSEFLATKLVRDRPQKWSQ
jgi:hypothetical protein